MGETYPMLGGDGAYGYAKNSQFQKQGSDSVKGMIQEAIIAKLDIQTLNSISTTLSIADYGCSVGPNTFFTMQNLIEAVENKCTFQGFDMKNLEFQVFFIDHTENDFNTLFASLPVDRNYHAAGVPGSFHGRLFPRASISLAYSSYAVHWLSKVPEGVSIFSGDGPGEVAKAYMDQFEMDMGVFLSARVEEIVRGGLMLLIIPVNTDEGLCSSKLHSGALFNLLGSSLMELVDEGVIEKSILKTLNMPMYFPTVVEMTKLIERNGGFSIEKMVVTNAKPVDAYSQIMHLRAGVGGIFVKHLGSRVEDELFAKTLAKSQELARLYEAGNHVSPQLFLALKRK